MEWKFELPDRSHSALDIQDYFEYITKKHETVNDNPQKLLYINKIESKITFKIKTRYYLQLLSLETMKLLGSTKCKVTKNENGDNLTHLQII